MRLYRRLLIILALLLTRIAGLIRDGILVRTNLSLEELDNLLLALGTMSVVGAIAKAYRTNLYSKHEDTQWVYLFRTYSSSLIILSVFLGICILLVTSIPWEYVLVSICNFVGITVLSFYIIKLENKLKTVSAYLLQLIVSIISIGIVYIGKESMSHLIVLLGLASPVLFSTYALMKIKVNEDIIGFTKKSFLFLKTESQILYLLVGSEILRFIERSLLKVNGEGVLSEFMIANRYLLVYNTIFVAALINEHYSGQNRLDNTRISILKILIITGGIFLILTPLNNSIFISLFGENFIHINLEIFWLLSLSAVLTGFVAYYTQELVYLEKRRIYAKIYFVLGLIRLFGVFAFVRINVHWYPIVLIVSNLVILLLIYWIKRKDRGLSSLVG